MALDKVEAYYWYIFTPIYESEDILAFNDPDFLLSDADTASISHTIHAVLPFHDQPRLYVESVLSEEGETIEERYAYIYYDAGGNRILQYDNRSHHPEISTHPHHMHKGPITAPGGQDRAWPTDIDFVSFETALQRIRDRFFS